MTDPSEQINNHLKGNYKSKINVAIASFFAGYFNEIPDMSISTVAEMCHVSAPSVVRFCREIGFEDYKDFKDSVEIFLSHADKDVGSRRNRPAITDDAQVRLMGDAIIDMFSKLDETKVRKLCMDKGSCSCL